MPDQYGVEKFAVEQIATACDINLRHSLNLPPDMVVQIDEYAIASALDGIDPVRTSDRPLTFIASTTRGVALEYGRIAGVEHRTLESMASLGMAHLGLCRQLTDGSLVVHSAVELDADGQLTEETQRTGLHELGHASAIMNGSYDNQAKDLEHAAVQTARIATAKWALGIGFLAGLITTIISHVEQSSVESAAGYGFATATVASTALYRWMIEGTKAHRLFIAADEFVTKQEADADRAMRLEVPQIITFEEM